MALGQNAIRNNAMDTLFVNETLGVLFVMKARAVLAEAAGPRRDFAKLVIVDPQQWAKKWVWFLLADPALANATTASMTTAIDTGWDLMAGA